jgi:hypothetical protein
VLTAAPGSDDPPQAISQPRTSAPAESTVPAFAAHRRSRPKPPRRRNGPSAYRVTAPHRPVRPPHQSPIVQPSWRRTLHRISRSSITRGDPDEHIDRGPQQAPRPGARQAHRPGSSAVLASSRRTTAETLSLWLLAHELKLGRLVTCTAAGPGSQPRARPELLGPTTRSSRRAGGAGPPSGHPTALRWGFMGFNSPGQSTHKPPSLTAASASSISRPGGTVGWLWNLRSEWTTWKPSYPSSTRTLHKPIDYRLKPDLARRAANARLGTGASSLPSGH